MKQKILRYILVCLAAVALLSTVAFAAMDASKYILVTNVSMVLPTESTMEADCTVTATGIYQDVGIKWIEFRKADDDTLVDKHWYTDPGYSYLMGHNKSSHTVSVICSREAGEKYYARVCFYAGTLGVAGDGYTMNSVIVP